MDEPKNGTAPETVETFPLDDAAIGAIAELDIQERCVNTARNAILSYFLAQHGISGGDWGLAPNRKELVKRKPVEVAVGRPAPVQ